MVCFLEKERKNITFMHLADTNYKRETMFVHRYYAWLIGWTW